MLFRGGRAAGPSRQAVAQRPSLRLLSSPTLRTGAPLRIPPAGLPAPGTCLPLLVPRPGQHAAPWTISQATKAPTSTVTLRHRRHSRSRGTTSPEPPPSDPPFVASPEQQRAIDTVLQGRNLFLTGCAGTGKSATLMELRRRLMAKYGSKQAYERFMAVVAMTGLAATIVEGVTLHSLLKLGLLETFGDFERMLDNDQLLAQLLQLETIVLDEAGMMSAEVFQTLDHYLTVARKKAVEKYLKAAEVPKAEAARLRASVDKPFGGLQLILSGDFFQLSPIEAREKERQSKTAAARTYDANAEQFRNRGFIFQAPVFHYGGFTLVELTKVFRQGDEDFVSLLNNIRCGNEAIFRAALEQLRSLCSRELDCSDGIKPTLLFSKNDEVRDRNERELAELPGKQRSFKAEELTLLVAEPPASIYASLVAQHHLTPEQFTQLKADLKAGEDQLGHENILETLPKPASQLALQILKDWRDGASSHLKEVARSSSGFYKQCQAADNVLLKEDAQVMLVRNMDLDANLANGSRGVVVGFQPLDDADIHRCVQMAAKVQISLQGSKRAVRGLDKEMTRWLNAHDAVPVVRFASGSTTKVLPAVFTAQVHGYGICARVQLPLKLAWAITVHKSQGMSLDRVVVDLANHFSHGMTYTALSRVRSIEGLQLLGSCSPKMDRRVLKWWAHHQKGLRYLDNEPPRPPHVPWSWTDERRPIAGHPQNPQAKVWLEQGPDAFFEWQQQQQGQHSDDGETEGADEGEEEEQEHEGGEEEREGPNSQALRSGSATWQPKGERQGLASAGQPSRHGLATPVDSQLAAAPPLKRLRHLVDRKGGLTKKEVAQILAELEAEASRAPSSAAAGPVVVAEGVAAWSPPEAPGGSHEEGQAAWSLLGSVLGQLSDLAARGRLRKKDVEGIVAGAKARMRLKRGTQQGQGGQGGRK